MVATRDTAQVGACSKCGGEYRIEHDGAGYVRQCGRCGGTQYDWLGDLKLPSACTGQGIHETFGTRDLGEVVSLEYALEHPSKRHPHVEFEATIYLWCRSISREIDLIETGLTPPPVLTITGQVHAAMRIWRPDSVNAKVTVDTITVPWHLDTVTIRDRVGIAKQFHAAIMQKIGRKVTPFSRDVLLWDWEAPPLAEGFAALESKV